MLTSQEKGGVATGLDSYGVEEEARVMSQGKGGLAVGPTRTALRRDGGRGALRKKEGTPAAG